MTLAPATAAPLPLDRLPAESRTTRPPTLELRAEGAGVLDLRALDRCVLELSDAWHGLTLHRRLKLQGTELRAVAFQRDQLVYRHVVDRKLYALLHLVTTQRIRCRD